MKITYIVKDGEGMPQTIQSETPPVVGPAGDLCFYQDGKLIACFHDWKHWKAETGSQPRQVLSE